MTRGRAARGRGWRRPRPPSRRSWSAASPAGWRAAPSAAAPSRVEPLTAEALERAQALHRRGPPSDRGARRSESHLLPWLSRRRRHHAAGARSRAVRSQAARRPAAARQPRRRRRCSCTRAASGERFTLYCSRARPSRETALRYSADGKVGAVLLGRERLRLGGERPGRQDAARRASPAPPTSSSRTARRRRARSGASRSAHVAARIVGLRRRAICASVPRARRRRPRAARCAPSARDRRAPPLPGRPLPLRRNVRPLLVPGGIASSTAPSSVGTRTLPPSTAS